MPKFSGPIHDFCRTTYPFTKQQIESKGTKLNVGCYYMKIDDFVNIDINPDVKPDLCCNMLDIDKHYGQNSIQGILISQCLEHVTKEQGIELLHKFFKILRPGGWLIVEVPDGNDIEGRFNRGEISKQIYDLLTTGHKEVAFQGHDSIYSTPELIGILQNIGYVNIKEMPLEMTSDKVEAIRIDCLKI
jgi:predicted SAM-dependent methyltransferase